jgi:hypothetical protein
VHDVIAGNYNEKASRTRNEIAERLFNLRKEAKKLSELENIKDKPSNTESQKRANNKKREQIESTIGKTDDLAARKTRIRNEIAKVKEQLSNGDFAKPVKKLPAPLDKEAKKLKDELLKLQEERDIRMMKEDFANRSRGERWLRFGGEILGTSRVLKSSFDVSYPLKQTLFGLSRQLLSFPFKKEGGKWVYDGFESQKQLGEQFSGMYRSFGSPKIYRRIMGEIKESPRFEMAQKSKLDLADPNSPFAEAREELRQKSLAHKVPVLKNAVEASDRAATVIANKMKWDIFNNLVDQMEENGRTFNNSPDAYKEAAIYANQLVGRGYLGQKLEMASSITSRIFFSLRLQASRLQFAFKLLNPEFYHKTPPEVRKAYIKDALKFTALMTTTLYLADKAGFSVGLDPRSSDFGKIRVGDTRIDVLGGLQQYIVLLSRITRGETVSSKTGRVSSLSHPKFKGDTRLDVLGKFTRSKLSPELGSTLNVIGGKDFSGQPTTIQKEAIDFVTPLQVSDVQSLFKTQDVQTAFFLTLLSLHGAGTQTFDDSAKRGGSGGGGGATGLITK